MADSFYDDFLADKAAILWMHNSSATDNGNSYKQQQYRPKDSIYEDKGMTVNKLVGNNQAIFYP